MSRIIEAAAAVPPVPRPLAWALANPAKLMVGLVLAVALAGYGVNSCSRRAAQERAATAEAGAAVADGQAKATQDAQRVVIDVVGHESAIDAQTRENADAIFAAEGARVAVPAGVAGAGRRALCMRPTYRREPACEQLLNPNP